MARVRTDVAVEVRRLGGTNLVISSNFTLRQDGLPRAGQRQPDDRGVAVYFSRKKQPFCFACDKWMTVEDNLWAIKLTIEALRQIERTGASDMLDRAFTGFLALPMPESWWQVLGISQAASVEEIKVAHRRLVKEHHPDRGGDATKFQRIQEAYEASLKEKRGNL